MRGMKLHDLHVQRIKMNLIIHIFYFKYLSMYMEFGGWIAGCMMSVRTRSSEHDASDSCFDHEPGRLLREATHRMLGGLTRFSLHDLDPLVQSQTNSTVSF